MQSEGSFPHSQEPITLNPMLTYPFRNIFKFLRWGVVGTSPNPQAGGPPPVGSPWLLIQYIASYPPYQAVPPSATWRRAMPWWQGPIYQGQWAIQELNTLITLRGLCFWVHFVLRTEHHLFCSLRLLFGNVDKIQSTTTQRVVQYTSRYEWVLVKRNFRSYYGKLLSILLHGKHHCQRKAVITAERKFWLSRLKVMKPTQIFVLQKPYSFL